MKLIMESWRKFVSENVSDSNIFDFGERTFSLGPETAQDVEFSGGVATSHVDAAMRELKIFNNGLLHEDKPEAWPEIAKYWAHIGANWAEEGTLLGYYGKNQPNKWHWSAAFIQYCMQSNPEFQKLKHSAAGPGNHKHYWMAAEENTEKLMSGTGGVSPNDWIMITSQQASNIGYEASVGDIAMQGKGTRMHGDIVTPVGKIGGNLGSPGTCKVTTARTKAIITQNPGVKQLLSQNAI